MTVYKNKKSHSKKWLIALVILVLGMTITWSSVEGAEMSPVLKVHKAHTSHATFGRSRFHPNWFPGFLKPPTTILASAAPLMNGADNKQTDVGTLKLWHSNVPTTSRMGFISQS